MADQRTGWSVDLQGDLRRRGQPVRDQNLSVARIRQRVQAVRRGNPGSALHRGIGTGAGVADGAVPHVGKAAGAGTLLESEDLTGCIIETAGSGGSTRSRNADGVLALPGAGATILRRDTAGRADTAGSGGLRTRIGVAECIHAQPDTRSRTFRLQRDRAGAIVMAAGARGLRTRIGAADRARALPDTRSRASSLDRDRAGAIVMAAGTRGSTRTGRADRAHALPDVGRLAPGRGRDPAGAIKMTASAGDLETRVRRAGDVRSDPQTIGGRALRPPQHRAASVHGAARTRRLITGVWSAARPRSTPTVRRDAGRLQCHRAAAVRMAAGTRLRAVVGTAVTRALPGVRIRAIDLSHLGTASVLMAASTRTEIRATVRVHAYPDAWVGTLGRLRHGAGSVRVAAGTVGLGTEVRIAVRPRAAPGVRGSAVGLQRHRAQCRRGAASPQRGHSYREGDGLAGHPDLTDVQATGAAVVQKLEGSVPSLIAVRPAVELKKARFGFPFIATAPPGR